MSEVKREAQLKSIQVNGATLAYFEYGEPRADAPTLLFVHATGFHGRVWDYHIARFPNHHCIAFEQRGHGRSESLAVDNWLTYGDDQIQLLATLGLQRVIGISHSMGSFGMICAAASSDAFVGLLLLDPTVFSPEAYTDDPFELPSGELHPASKRRNSFSSPQEMIDRLQGKGAFGLYHPDILRDYCVHGLTQTDAGDFRLLCDPAVEAQVYMTSRGAPEILERAEEVQVPVVIVRAKSPVGDGHDFSSSPTWPGLVDRFPNAIEHFWADCSHFIPMERPDAVVELLAEHVETWRGC